MSGDLDPGNVSIYDPKARGFLFFKSKKNVNQLSNKM